MGPFGGADLFLLPVGCAAATESDPSDDAEGLGTVRQAETLETTYDPCSSTLYILPDAGEDWPQWTKVTRGVWTTYRPIFYNAASTGIHWKCGNSLEKLFYPVGTDTMKVFPSVTSRQITWKCTD